MQNSSEAPRTQQTGFGSNGHSRPRTVRPRNRMNEEKNIWHPVTNLGRLVKAGCINSIEEIFLHSFIVKEVEIIDHFFSRGKTMAFGSPTDDTKPVLHDEVVGISPVQKQSSSGQRTRFRALVIVGDCDGHVGFGAKCDKEVATAIRGAIIAAKLSIFPIRRGYWGSSIGKPHTVPMKVSGKCASVLSRLIPAPRGTGIVGSPITKKVLNFAGVHDCFTNTSGHSRTTGNFIHATINALQKTYSVLTPDLWSYSGNPLGPLDIYYKVLEKAEKVSSS